MKVYGKPALTLLTVSASDALCQSTCAIKTRGNPTFIVIDQELGNGDGLLEPGDNVFANADDYCTSFYEGYCKFSGPDNQMLFTS
jgi:hypothetical protein